VLDGIAAERRVIVFDNRGIGGSTGRVPRRVEAMADDAVAFMDALGLEEVDLLGFSLGGFVAQVIATVRPTLVRRLILTGTGPSGFKGVGQFNRRLLADGTQGAITRTDPKPLLFFTRTQAGRRAAKDYMARLAERPTDRVPKTSISGALAQLVAIKRWGSQQPMDLQRVAVPTLVANGEDDRMLASRGSFDLAHRIPRAELVIYPDAGHGGVFQHHEKFVQTVMKFLN
jgi:pimeloyl-ACP methyl ester carboxylesterase